MGNATSPSGNKKLGVNGFGRIGKLTLWHHVGRKFFDEIIVNIGRQPGTCLEDIAHYLERDSTYGWLHGYLHGHNGQPVIEDLDEASGSMNVDGVK
ncbi:MAG: glyceraldehyde 3-phosphate dehydrogenase NAD-binding domain-containing protein, partial [Desulfobacterales bacterium]